MDACDLETSSTHQMQRCPNAENRSRQTDVIQDGLLTIWGETTRRSERTDRQTDNPTDRQKYTPTDRSTDRKNSRLRDRMDGELSLD